jgi:regulatory protein
LRLLVAREHSRAELRRKLLSRSLEPGLVEQVLDDLEEQRYLSDDRFVEQYIASRKRKGYGPVRIRAELREKGVDSTRISHLLDEQDPEWRQLLIQELQRKFGDAGAGDQRDQAKRARFLEYRGFPAPLIRNLLWDD